jgi:hypothetical protein
MKKFLSACLIICTTSLVAQSQLQFIRNDSVRVLQQSDTLLNPWAGGLNFSQFSAVDLDLDGKDDLFVLDRTGFRISTFLNVGGPNETRYKHAPQYVNALPEITGWAILRDYNCDGMADLFTYGAGPSGGIDLYENTSSIPNGLQFQLVAHLLKANMTPNSTNIYDDIKITAVDIPAIRDVDNDNDLDILTFDVGGTTVEWFRNMSQELYGVCDSLRYRLETSCWGEFTENNLNSSISLNTPCAPPPIALQSSNTQRELRHAGSCLECINTNGDADQDLLIGDLTNDKIVYTRNDGTPTSADMNAADVAFPSYDTSVNMSIFVCAYHLDLNNDGADDLVVSPNATTAADNYNSNWFYKNTGTNNSVTLEFEQRDFLQDGMIECGEGAVPRWFDYDSDGDLDLFIGNYGYYLPSGIYPSKIALYKNTGSVNAPEYTFITDDFASLHANAYNINTPVPTFGDLDGDGDKDMLVGDVAGRLHFFRKDPGPADNFVLAQASYQSIDVGSNATPQLIDIDRDGKLDLLIGEQSGNLNYFRNTGTSAAPVFSLISNTFGGIDVQEPSSISGFSVPCLWDNNGNYVLLVGSERGFIYRYDNIEGNLAGNFTLTDSTYVTTHEGLRVAPWLGYLNGDTLIDLVVGNYSGGVVLFYGDLLNDIEVVSQQARPTLNVYPNPAADHFYISGWSSSTNFPVTLTTYDITGAMVRTEIIHTPQQEISTAALVSGCYFGTITDQEGVSSALRFVVAKNDER